MAPCLPTRRRESLRRRRAELRLRIPASSPDPNLYRDVILAIAGAMLAADGPASRPELNAALVAAYPEWFAAPDVATATRCQRRIRGREDVWRVLKAVLADGRPGQATLPGARQDPAAALTAAATVRICNNASSGEATHPFGVKPGLAGADRIVRANLGPARSCV